MTYPNYLVKRKEKLKKWLKDHKHAGCLIQDPDNLFYYTGLHLSAGILFFTPRKQVLIADHRYSSRCEKLAPFDVIAVESYEEGLKKLSFPKKTIVDGQLFTLHQAKGYKKYTSVHSVPGFLRRLRMIKDQNEIRALKKSCEITKGGYEYIRPLLKEGVTEKEIALKLEMYYRSQGAEKMSFDPIVAFGKNSANPHYTPADVKLKKNDVVLIDSGCIYQGYCSDMTRTYLIGKVSPKMQKIYDLTEEVQKRAVQLCKPGVSLKSIDEMVHQFFDEHKVDELFIHSLGHGVGIEIHELPTFNMEGDIEPGMAITVEPGLYIDGLGGVRIEDTILVTSKGYENLTRS